MSIFQRLKRRAAFAVGDTELFIRELTFRQLDLVKALDNGDLQTWLTLAFCLVNENGEPAYSLQDGETPTTFAERVKADGSDFVTAGILNEIMQAMTKLSTPANQEQLAKK